MATLSTNVDATWPDRSPGDKQHQQDHDALHDRYNNGDAYTAGLVNDTTPSATRTALTNAFGRSKSIREYGALGDGSDNGAVIQAALDDLAPLVGTVWEKGLYFPAGNYLSNQPLTGAQPIVISGDGRLATRIGIGPSFPAGQTLFSFARSPGVSEVNLENRVPGFAMHGLTLDGNLRSTQAHALRLADFNRIRLDIGVNAFNGSALVATSCLSESHITGLRTWLCGNASSPTVDLDDQSGDTAGHNLNHFHGVDLMYCLGDMLRVRGAVGVTLRYQNFSQCTLHGFEEWLDDYYDDFGTAITLTDEGNVPARIVIDNARGISFSQCRIRQAGRGQPAVLLSNRSAGSGTVNSVSITESYLTFRGGSYSTRTLGTVDVTGNTLSVTGVNTNRHDLQTGSRVQFTGTSLPAPLAVGTDYYAIRTTSTTFQVATSYTNALAGTAVTLTATGAGTVTQLTTAVVVDATADTLTAPDHRLSTGARFRVTGATLPGGLAANTDYFVIRIDKDTLKLATTRANAESGTAIDLTSTGSQVAIGSQDFLVDLESGTLQFDGNTVDIPTLGAVTRGYFRAETGTTVIIGATNTWPTSPTLGVTEYASGGGQLVTLPAGLVLGLNNLALYVTRTDGTAVQAVRMTVGNTVQVGSLSGTDNANLVGAGLATVVGGGAERFRAGAGGLSFNGVTALVARRTVNAAATDATTTQALVNQLRQLLVDLGLAQ